MLSSCGATISSKTAVSHGLARLGVLYSNFCRPSSHYRKLAVGNVSFHANVDVGTFYRKMLVLGRRCLNVPFHSVIRSTTTILF